MGAFNSKEFKALQREWAGKLKASGFDDLEKPDGSLVDDDRLGRVLAKSDIERQAIAEYYRLAQTYGDDVENFATLREGIVWGLHARAVPIRQIARVVRSSKDAVWRVILRHRKAAGLRLAA